MGWLFMNCTRADLIRKLTEASDTEQANLKTLAHTLRGNVLWSVVEISYKQEPNPPERFIRCDLLQRYGERWGFKPMDESWHPYYYTCPLSYLDLAPEKSPEWREKVREYHAARRAQHSRRKLERSRHAHA